MLEYIIFWDYLKFVITMITFKNKWTTCYRKVQTWAAVVGAVPYSTHACAETESRVWWGTLKAKKKLDTLNPGGQTERIKGLLKVCRIILYLIMGFNLKSRLCSFRIRISGIELMSQKCYPLFFLLLFLKPCYSDRDAHQLLHSSCSVCPDG